MNALPRYTLTRIVAQHGRQICDLPRRLEALLRDLCGAHRREINVLMGALEERVAEDLIAAGKSLPREVLLKQLVRRLQDDLAYTPAAARWAVDSWAVALGVLSEEEFKVREQAERGGDDNQQGFAPLRSSTQSSSTLNATTHTPQQQKGAPARPQASPAAPPTVKPSVQPPIIVAAPPSPRTLSVSPQNATNSAPGTLSGLAPPQKRLLRRAWTFRSCLASLLLIIVLIAGAVFIVPTIIALLREEQAQPDINGPRIR